MTKTESYDHENKHLMILDDSPKLANVTPNVDHKSEWIYYYLLSLVCALKDFLNSGNVSFFPSVIPFI